MGMTCDRPVRDRNGEAITGVTCNLEAQHLGKCAQTARIRTLVCRVEDIERCHALLKAAFPVVPSEKTEEPHVRTQEP